MRTSTSPAALAVALFFLAPLVGEWLLGNQPITELPALVLLAPLYGGGALLVREIARRTGHGWRAIVLLAACYALIEEGPIDQMIYNPAYLGLQSFAGELEIPGTGTSLTLVLASLALHTVWSICTPIALVESFDPSGRPWLHTRGLASVATLFIAASALLTWAQADEFDFFASAGQLIGTALAIAALAVAAFMVPALSPRPGRPPAPLVVGAAAFALTSVYWAESLATSYLIDVTPWLDVVTFAVLVTFGVGLVLAWSRSEGWSAAHRVALASGAALTYAWVGFTNSIELDVSHTVALFGSSAFATLTVALVVWANRRLRRSPTFPDPVRA